MSASTRRKSVSRSEGGVRAGDVRNACEAMNPVLMTLLGRMVIIIYALDRFGVVYIIKSTSLPCFEWCVGRHYDIPGSNSN